MPATTETTWSRMVAARVGTGQPAVINPDGSSWTLDELLARAAGAAAWLDSIGADPGLPVPALLPSSVPAFALMFAGAGSDRPLAPLSPRFTMSDLIACVRSVNAGVVIGASGARDVLRELGERTGLPYAIVPEEFPTPTGRDLNMDPAPDAVIAVIHTSGTTGGPKGVYQRQRPMASRVGRSADPIEMGPGSRYATASAFHHQAGAGLFLVAMGAGATLVPFPEFSPAGWKALEALGPTHATVVPALIEKLLAADVLALPTLRYVQYGSSPLHPDTARYLLTELQQLQLVQQLGQTEGSPITTLDHHDHLEALADAPHRLKSVGRPIVGTQLRIENPDDEGVGEICSMADHYFAPDPDGWLRTGDLGYQDEDDFVYLVGRKHDVINRGGDKIYPVEVEQVITTHPAVVEAAVVGVPDRVLGSVPHAFVVAPDSARPTPDELFAYTRDRLTGYKVPHTWHFVDELPRNPANKILRYVLRDSVTGTG